MSPKKRRAENRGLPRRWQRRHGAIYYRVPPGEEHRWNGKQMFRLGATEPEAYRVWADRVERGQRPAASIEDLAERYLLEHVMTLSPKTRESYRPSLERVVAAFGRMAPSDVEPHHCRAYFDRVRTSRSLAVARSDLTVLRGMLAKALDWGILRHHPMAGMRFETLPAATRDVAAWEVDAMLSIPATTRTVRLAQLYTRLKLMLGLRRGDMLRLRLSDLRDDGIHVTPAKTIRSSGVTLIFQWVDETGEPIRELAEVVDAIRALPPRRIGDAFLFTTREGRGFIDETTGRANGFDTLWTRFIDRVLAETPLSERIKEKDLRALVGAESASDEDARHRLGHTSVATTRRHYRRRPRLITPLTRGGS